MRDAALHAAFNTKFDGKYYPGDNSVGAYEMQGLNEVVSSLVQEPVMRTPDTVHCKFA